jgi:hypothetical protein
MKLQFSKTNYGPGNWAKHIALEGKSRQLASHLSMGTDIDEQELLRQKSDTQLYK